jgi:hypothetical protein
MRVSNKPLQLGGYTIPAGVEIMFTVHGELSAINATTLAAGRWLVGVALYIAAHVSFILDIYTYKHCFTRLPAMGKKAIT